MINFNDINLEEDEYFKWLCGFVEDREKPYDISFTKLFTCLYLTEFIWPSNIPNDQNRAEDGISLRRRFELIGGYIPESIINKPCNVLEMMVALSLRCEETIMDDPMKGNRTRQWFWEMISSLGLNGMYNSNFDLPCCQQAIDDLLYRNYKPNGKGGLFTIRGCEYDLRKEEIWYQLCWYLDSIA